jgi:Leucine-rich repeat (LRR) protein
LILFYAINPNNNIHQHFERTRRKPMGQTHSITEEEFITREKIISWEEEGDPTAELDISYMCLKKLPKLPNTLQKLNCGHNKLTELPEKLPDDLELLNCEYNSLTYLPDTLPPKLEHLNCMNNRIIQLPETLPKSLLALYCGHNHLLSLPQNLPESLKCLNCDDNNLAELPEKLPPDMYSINCGSNILSKLPTRLPATLKYLYCQSNPIRELPQTIPQNMVEIQYFNTNLQFKYPLVFPESLKYLGTTKTCIDENESKRNSETMREYIDRLQNQSDYHTKHLSVKKTKSYKEQLMKRTWHPNRLTKWCLDYEEAREWLAT